MERTGTSAFGSYSGMVCLYEG